jgi:periplasmic divalent cation tolerance protein
MKRSGRHFLVFVTVPNRRVARKLARAALAQRAAACANILSSVESHYWWKDKVESASELLIIFKTTTARLATLESVVHSHHPYDTPEFVIAPLEGGSERYLAWLDESVRGIGS